MPRPRVAVWKLSSCDGCQLALLDGAGGLPALAAATDLRRFPEASSSMAPGPYDLSFVEGSVSTEAQRRAVREIRAQSRTLVAIGACAVAGGVQALRNGADFEQIRAAAYPRPDAVDALADSTPVSAHIAVDLTLGGCPVSAAQVREVVAATLIGRAPRVTAETQCAECKRAGTPCVTVVAGEPCLGPVTRAGCGNLCPPLGRGCFGCFGPVEEANPAALERRAARPSAEGVGVGDLVRRFNAAAPGGPHG